MNRWNRVIVVIVTLLALAGLWQGIRAFIEPGGEEMIAQSAQQTKPTELPSAPALSPQPVDPTVPPDEVSLPTWLASHARDWKTDWSKKTIDFTELLAGGPPRDGIPSIDQPTYETYDEASEWLASNEPVLVINLNQEAVAYPLQILLWHEIVNDVVGGVPVAVTYCPLCNSAVVFERTIDGRVTEFGVSGLLRHSDLVMYDRYSESLWQQLTGEGIVGAHAGSELEIVPSSIVSFADFAAFPDGLVLSRNTGYGRPYGRTPYRGYDEVGSSPFLFDGVVDERLAAVERVVTVSLEQGDFAYPYALLNKKGVIHDQPEGRDLVVFHLPGTASALDEVIISEAKDVGATGVFNPFVDGQKLTFSQGDGVLIDDQTGSEWNIFGMSIAGELQGKQLELVTHGDHFWFAWAAYKPDTIVYSDS
ncbi:MAG: DUF3179 domain-containing protein [Chloroflexota bacterium]